MSKRGSNSVADFHRRFSSMADFFKKNGVARGFDMAFINDMFMPLFALWVAIYMRWLDKLQRTPAVTAEKNELFEKAKKVYAEGARMIKGNLQTSDAERIALEIAPNASGSHQPKPVVQTHPQVDVDTSEHSQLTIWWREEGAKFPNKPDGVNHVKVVWARLLEPPTSRAQLVNEFIDTDNPHILKFVEEETGGIVYYAACWVSNTGEEGPWSPIAFAVIP